MQHTAASPKQQAVCDVWATSALLASACQQQLLILMLFTIQISLTTLISQSMDPHLLLLIFLPIIGFSASVSQEPHMLRRSWGQVSADVIYNCSCHYMGLLHWLGIVGQPGATHAAAQLGAGESLPLQHLQM